MEALDAARMAVSLTGGWFPYSINSRAVTIEEMALAAVARCRRLLQGMVDLHDSPDLAGNLARALFETWLTGVYLLLGQDDAYERLDANDRHLRYRTAKRSLDQLKIDAITGMVAFRQDAEAVVSEGRPTVGELSVEAIAQKVRKLLLAEGDANAVYPLRGYVYLYGPESYTSTHGGIGAIKQHMLAQGRVGDEIVAGPWDHSLRGHRLDLCTAMFAAFARRTAESLGLDHAELDHFAAEWLAAARSRGLAAP